MLLFNLAPLLVGILAVMFLSLLSRLQRMDTWSVFWAGVVAGVVGVVLLFLARLPLYRRGQFLVFGPRLLDAPHRRLYYWAYVFVAISLLLLLGLIVWLHG